MSQFTQDAAGVRSLYGVEYPDHNRRRIRCGSDLSRLEMMTEALDLAACLTLPAEKQIYIQIRLAWCRLESMRRTIAEECERRQGVLFSRASGT